MWYVYILQSLKTGRYYIGETEDVQERLQRHNAGRVPVTRYGRPWKLVYTETYLTRSEARKREKEIKRYKGGIQYKALLAGTLRKR